MIKLPFRLKFSTDVFIIAALVLLLFAWGPVYKKFLAPPAAVPVEKPVPAEKTVSAEKPIPPPPVAESVPAIRTGGASGSVSVISASASAVEPSQSVANPESPSIWLPSGFRVEADPVGQSVVLSNAVIRLTLSSKSGGIQAAELDRFPLTDHPESGPVILDFGDRPALAYVNLPGLVPAPGFEVVGSATSHTARFTARTPAGLRFERTLTLNDQYEVIVSDTFVNDSDQPILLDDHGLQVGPMSLLPGEVRGKADVFFGIDSLATGEGEKVKHWNASGNPFSGGVTLAEQFQPESRRGGCSMRRPPLGKVLPMEIAKRVNADLEWVAVKNRFFVQILTPVQGGTALDLQAVRSSDRSEDPTDSATWMDRAVLKEVSAVAHFGTRNLEPKATMTHEAHYYIGPRDYSIIKNQGNHQDKVMEFGMWSWMAGILVHSLQGIHHWVPNYGLAIILITLIIRGLFWPITHKGTESMKRMQAIQPLVAELRVKYKDNAQKLQQATMALYKEHKVNPLGGCLPLLIQIPVFIALFNVLRSDIALRFADFLWVRDLSEPENLMMGLLPWGLGFNILPIYMAATMAWQTHLTPSAGDPAQQKMMMFMPIMMLFFFYTMPSGLVLYWSANQTMMIVQLTWQRYQTRKKGQLVPAR